MFDDLCQALVLDEVKEEFPGIFTKVKRGIPLDWPRARQAQQCVAFLYRDLQDAADGALGYFESRPQVIKDVQGRIRTQCLPPKIEKGEPMDTSFLDASTRKLRDLHDTLPGLKGSKDTYNFGLICLGFEAYYEGLQRRVHQQLSDPEMA